MCSKSGWLSFPLTLTVCKGIANYWLQNSRPACSCHCNWNLPPHGGSITTVQCITCCTRISELQYCIPFCVSFLLDLFRKSSCTYCRHHVWSATQHERCVVSQTRCFNEHYVPFDECAPGCTTTKVTEFRGLSDTIQNWMWVNPMPSKWFIPYHERIWIMVYTHTHIYECACLLFTSCT